MEKILERLGWDIMDDTACIEVENTVDPRIVNVTISFKAIKHEFQQD